MTDEDPGAAASANLRRYGWYVAGSSLHAWMPIFFLYFTSKVTLPEALKLEAIYYACVVALELPSGYLSDRIGRARTLAIASMMLLTAHVIFMVGGTFWQLAIAQAMLAAAIAFNSGTDASLHLESLAALGREDEYAEREAKVSALSFGCTAVAALAGGAAGMWDLRLAYALSAAGAVVAIAAAQGFSGTGVTLEHWAGGASGEVAASGFGAALRECVGLASGPHLRWLFAAAAVATLVNHIPYEFYQPYLRELDEVRVSGFDATPLIAGAHMTAAQLLAALGARVSARLSARVGLAPHVLAAMSWQVGLIGLMAWMFHPAIAALLLTRSLASALQTTPLRAATAPRVPRRVRATFLSMQSLAGRLALASALWALARASDDLAGALTWAAALAAAALLFIVVLALSSPPPVKAPVE